MGKYTQKDINESLGLDFWGWKLIIKPLVVKIGWIFANYTNLSPNQITILSFIFGLISAFFFLQRTIPYLIIGSLLFELSIILDIIDGSIARLKGIQSKIGAYLDITTDLIKYFFIVLCLTYGQFIITKDISFLIFGNIFIFLETLTLSQWSIIYSGKYKRPTYDTLEGMTEFNFITKVKRYIDPNNRMPFIPLDSVEAETIAFLIAPILTQIKLGLIFAILILFVNILATIMFNLRFLKIKKETI